MSKALIAAIRTYLQSVIGIFLGLWGISGLSDTSKVHGAASLNVLVKLILSALIGGLPALLAYVQNALENSGKIPALLKKPANPNGPGL